MQKSSPKGAIIDRIPEIICNLNEYDIVVISAPGGSGKSIVVPWFLSQLADVQQVLVSVSNSQVAASLTTKISNYTIDTKRATIRYMSADDMKKMLLAKPKLNNTIIIVGDASNQSITNSVITALWKDLVKPNNDQTAKLVIMSSTVHQVYSDAKLLNFTNLTYYPIRTIYHNRDYEFGDNNIFKDVTSVALDMHFSTITGDILIFVADSGDVDYMAKILKQSQVTSIEIHTLGLSNQSGNNYIWSESKLRRVIIAPAQLEFSTSIFPSDVAVIIDTMLARQSMTTLSGGYRLKIRHIDKITANIRKSQVGRQSEGLCYRMCTEGFYITLPDKKIPEIHRSPLYLTLLELLDSGFDPYILKTITIPQEIIDDNLNLIRQLNIVDKDNRLTNKGRFISSLPIGPRLGATLWEWLQLKLPAFPAICALALIDSYGPSYYWYPPRQISKTQRTTSDFNLARHEQTSIFFAKFKGYNDLETMLNWWLDLLKNTGGLNAPTIEYVVWARRNCILPDKVREVYSVVNMLNRFVNDAGHKVDIGPFSAENTLMLIKPILAQIYSDNILYLDPNGSVLNLSYLSPLNPGYMYKLSPFRNMSMLVAKPPKYLISLVTTALIDMNTSYDIEIGVDINEDLLPVNYRSNLIPVDASIADTVLETAPKPISNMDDIPIFIPEMSPFAQQVISDIDEEIRASIIDEETLV